MCSVGLSLFYLKPNFVKMWDFNWWIPLKQIWERPGWCSVTFDHWWGRRGRAAVPAVGRQCCWSCPAPVGWHCCVLTCCAWEGAGAGGLLRNREQDCGQRMNSSRQERAHWLSCHVWQISLLSYEESRLKVFRILSCAHCFERCFVWKPFSPPLKSAGWYWGVFSCLCLILRMPASFIIAAFSVCSSTCTRTRFDCRLFWSCLCFTSDSHHWICIYARH